MNKQQLVIEAKDVESAIKEGLRRLGTSQDQADIKILQDATPGLFERDEQPARVKLSAQGSDLNEQIRSTLDSFLQLMGIQDATIELEMDDEIYNINIDAGDQQRFVIGPEGETINALQHLLQCSIRRETDQPISLLLDAGDYRERRREKLRKKAKRTIEQVCETGEEQEMVPMEPIERKMVHKIVDEDDRVKSMSIGEDANRRVVIQTIGSA